MGQAAIPNIIRFGTLHPGIAIGIACAIGVVGVISEAQKVQNNIKSSELPSDTVKQLEKKFGESCCCGKRVCNRLFFIKKKSKKEAKEAALHYFGAHGVMHHPHNTHDNLPHFHPTYDSQGRYKIPGVHFQYPR